MRDPLISESRAVRGNPPRQPGHSRNRLKAGKSSIQDNTEALVADLSDPARKGRESMANEAPESTPGADAEGAPSPVDAADARALHGAVLVGVVPGLPTRVLKEAGRYARLLQAPLVVVHVDVTRFVTYEDPDGYVHSAPIDINVTAGENDLAVVEAEATRVL